MKMTLEERFKYEQGSYEGYERGFRHGVLYVFSVLVCIGFFVIAAAKLGLG